MPRAKLESEFVQYILKPELNARFPGCFIYKMDPNQVQGIQDLLVLYKDKYALLETKRGSKSAAEPNQVYYVEKFDKLAFSAFVNPDNYREVLDELQKAFGA